MLRHLCGEERRQSLTLRHSTRHTVNSRCPVLFQVTQKSGARVRISSDGGESEGQNVCFLLHGSKEQLLLAQCVLQNLAIDCEPLVEVLEIPQAAFGRIIGNWRVYSFYSLLRCSGAVSYLCVSGRGGEGLKLITRTTGARVSCSKERTQTPGAKGTVTIRGTREEVKLAKVSQSFGFVARF